MHLRRKVLAVCAGAIMMLGSLLVLPSPASAASGDLYSNGTLTLGGLSPVTISGWGWGSTASSYWSGDFSGSGLLVGCIQFEVVTPTFENNISWNLSPPYVATQVLSSFDITVDSTSCPAPPQSICTLSVLSPKTLTAFSFNLSGGHRTGSFTTGVATPVGLNTITGTGIPTSCPTGPGTLHQILDLSVGGPTGTGLFRLNLSNDLEI